MVVEARDEEKGRSSKPVTLALTAKDGKGPFCGARKRKPGKYAGRTQIYDLENMPGFLNRRFTDVYPGKYCQVF
jgi:hypothetical protein